MFATPDAPDCTESLPVRKGGDRSHDGDCPLLPGEAALNRLRSLAEPLEHRDFRYLWAAQVFSELGDWSGRLALALVVAERTHSAAITALVTSLSVLPYIGLGQILSTLANRFPRRRTILLTDLVRAALFALMALELPVPMLLVLAFAAGVCTPPFEAARNSLTPLSVPRETYGAAIALASLTFEMSVLFGYASGGGLVALLGARAALLANSASFLVSAALLVRIPAANEPNAPEGRRVTISDGWHALMDEPYVRRFLASFTIVGACAVVIESLVTVYGLTELNLSSGEIGLLAASMPAGAIVAVTLGRSSGADNVKMRRAAQMALAGAAVGFFVFGAGSAMPLVLLGFGAAGCLNASRVPANEVAVLRIEDAVRIPAFSIIDGFLAGSQALSAAVGGVIAREIGLRPTFAGAMAIAAIAGAWGVLDPPRRRPRHMVKFSEQQSR